MFKQYGFIPAGMSGGSQVAGNCIFCGDKSRFYVNPATKKWDCKVCGKAGGYLSFITEAYEMSSSGHSLQPLSDHRSIQVKTLERFNVRYLSVASKFLIPLYTDVEHKHFADIRLYDLSEKKPKLKSTAGCSPTLINFDLLSSSDCDTVWLCEGEWDTMVMDEIIENLGERRSSISVGVPGALTFKPEWIPMFRGKKVRVVYDNDFARTVNGKEVRGTGEIGMKKVYSMLVGSVEDIQFIHWPDGTPDHYDIRDFYKDRSCDAKRTMRGIKRLLHPVPPNYTEDITVVKYTDDMVNYRDVHKVYKKWLHLTDENVIDLLYGTIIANRMPGDPLWMFLVAKSGDAKSAFLMSFSKAKNIYTATSFTQHTLISGFGSTGGSDPSLIPRLRNKVLVIKDFTTILTVNPNERDAIFGILRDIYDGKIEKTFGNGVYRSYESTFGFLAGVTPAIELYIDGHTALGERFLSYRLQTSDDLSIERLLCRKAIENTEFEIEMRDELSDIAKKALNYDYTKAKPEASDTFKDKIISLAQWTSILRGSINRDKYSKEITHKPFCERPTRLAKQLFKLAIAIGQFRGLSKLTDAEYSIIRDVGRSTVPSRVEDAVREIYKNGMHKEYTANQIVEILGLPEITTKRLIENMCLLGVLSKNRKEVGVFGNICYRLSDHILKLIEDACIYEKPEGAPDGKNEQMFSEYDSAIPAKRKPRKFT